MNKELIIERTAKQNYKKIDIDKLKDDDFVKKSYFKTMNLYDARMRFKFASKMFPTVRMNFQSDRKFMAEGWKCLGCAGAGDGNTYRDSQEHVLVCEGYSRFREGIDLQTDAGLVKYCHDVIMDRLNCL